MAVDTTRNKIYTANLTSNDVTVMDGTTNVMSPVPLEDVQDPYTVAVNPITNKIYVANLTSKSVTVIDGATNKAVTIGDLPGKPHDVVVNPVTNKIYFPLFVLYRGAQVGDDRQITGLIAELDGATNALTFVIAGITPYAVAVNTTTNKVYVVNQDGNTVTVLTASGGKAQ
jgi:YVTN family beta-propeller protein